MLLFNQKQREAARPASGVGFRMEHDGCPARGIVDQPAPAPERVGGAFLSGGDPVVRQVAPAGLLDQFERDRAPCGDQPRQRLLLGWAAPRPDRNRSQHGRAVRARQCQIASSDDPQQRQQGLERSPASTMLPRDMVRVEPPGIERGGRLRWKMFVLVKLERTRKADHAGRVMRIAKRLFKLLRQGIGGSAPAQFS